MLRGSTLAGGHHRVAGIGAAGVLAVAAGSVLSLQAAHAQIEGAQVARGSATFQNSNGRTVITAADNTVINYSRFDIQAGQSVQFIQPGADSRVLNRISSSAPTRIDGSLLANGRVYLVNPAGVVFGKNAVIDAARFVAAAAKMTDQDFLRGNDHFGSVGGAVVNDGAVSAGSVHLIGRVVANHGTIVARGGVVTMLSGSDVLVREEGSRISVRIDGKDLEAAATGGAAAPARPARVAAQTASKAAVVTTRRLASLGAGDVLSMAISNSGSVSVGGGTAMLGAPSGSVENSGVVDAGVDAGQAGTVVVHGQSAVNTGVVSAVAGEGRGGRVVFTSTRGTTLADGSVITVAGGGGVADGGRVLVHSYGGSTMFAPGAVIDLSGGALGGDAGYAEVSATGGLGFRGVVLGNHAAGYADAGLYLDPRDVYIVREGAQDAAILDGVIEAYESLDDYFVSAGAIESFLGNVRIDAARDILISDSIHKTNGDLRLEAGRDIVFGVAPTPVCPPPGPCDPKDPCDKPKDPCDKPKEPCAPPPPAPCAPTPCGDQDGSSHGGGQGGGQGRGRPGRGGNLHCSDERPTGGSRSTSEHARGRSGHGDGDGGGQRRGGHGGCDPAPACDNGDGQHGGGGCDGGPPSCDPVPCDPPPCDPPPCDPPPCDPPPCDPPPGCDHPPVDCPTPAPIETLTVEANNVTLIAGHSILDQTVQGTRVGAYTGDVVLQGTTGVVQFGTVQVPSGREVHINQGEGMLVDGVHNRILDAEHAYVSLKSFDGSVTFDTPDGSGLAFGYLNVSAHDDVVVEDPISVGSDAVFRAGEGVSVGASIVSCSGFILLNSGLSGNGGGVAFSRPGVVLGAGVIDLVAGGPGVGGDARVDALTNAPEFRGAQGAAGTSPSVFRVAQNPTVTSEDLPRYGQFGGGLSCETQYTVQSFDGDVVMNDGSPVAGSHLILRSASAIDPMSSARVFINGDLELCNLLVEGHGTLNADVFTLNTQTYAGDVLVQDEVALTGKRAYFLSTVDSLVAGAGGLTVNAETFFRGTVGGSAPLSYLVVNGDTTLGGEGAGPLSVVTVGDQRYNGAVWIMDDVAMLSQGGGVVRFGGTLDGAHDLLVQSAGGLIVFSQDVGSLEALGRLTLCTDGADGVEGPIGEERDGPIPRRATIIGEGDLPVHVTDFVVCTGEKFTVLGSLDLHASHSAVLGDVTTVGDMRVTAPSIVLLRRPASGLYNDAGELVQDLGVDYVAGGGIFMDGEVSLGGSGGLPPPRFGSAVGVFSAALASYERRVMDPAETSVDALVDELNRVLDQRVPAASPPPPPPPPPLEKQLLEDARPRDPMFRDRVIPTVYDVEGLRSVAIAGRGVSSRASMGLSRAVYNDSPGEAEFPLDVLESAATRFDVDSVHQIVALHDAVFGAGPGAEDRTGAMLDSVQKALCCYKSCYGVETVDPHQFAVFTRENGCGAGARKYLLDVDRLLVRLRNAGLTPVEYVAVRNRLLVRLAPIGSFVGVTELAHVIEAVHVDEVQNPVWPAV